MAEIGKASDDSSGEKRRDMRKRKALEERRMFTIDDQTRTAPSSGTCGTDLTKEIFLDASLRNEKRCSFEGGEDILRKLTILVYAVVDWDESVPTLCKKQRPRVPYRTNDLFGSEALKNRGCETQQFWRIAWHCKQNTRSRNIPQFVDFVRKVDVLRNFR